MSQLFVERPRGSTTCVPIFLAPTNAEKSINEASALYRARVAIGVSYAVRHPLEHGTFRHRLADAVAGRVCRRSTGAADSASLARPGLQESSRFGRRPGEGGCRAG